MTDAIQKAREALETALNSIGDLIVVNGQVSWTAVARIQDELMRDVAALAALDAETEVKVRELTFVDRGLGIAYADSVVGTYKINGDGYWWRDDGSIEGRGGQAAVQADFERRIRSALVTPGVPVMSGLDEGQIEPCGGCGEADPSKRCFNCHHEFFPSRRAATPADVGEEPVAFAYVRDGHLFALSPDKSVQCPDPLYSATALEQVTRERDEARATLDEVCLSSRQEWQRATSAEAKLAEARKVIEDALARAKYEPGDHPIIPTKVHEALGILRRWIEETK